MEVRPNGYTDVVARKYKWCKWISSINFLIRDDIACMSSHWPAELFELGDKSYSFPALLCASFTVAFVPCYGFFKQFILERTEEKNQK
jgi:hypothetical protein